MEVLRLSVACIAEAADFGQSRSPISGITSNITKVTMNLSDTLHISKQAVLSYKSSQNILPCVHSVVNLAVI